MQSNEITILSERNARKKHPVSYDTILGMENAFSAGADFSNMTDAAINISMVLHKTHVEVDEKGTKAAAATVVGATPSAAAIDTREPKYVRLDRPFIYMIVDNCSNLPLFIGTVNDITN